MYRLPGDRVALELDGPHVEVEPIHAWAIYAGATGLMAAVVAAKGAEASYAALKTLYGFFVLEAQPQWDIVDHRGPIATDANGMMRLPTDIGTNLPLGMVMAQMWIDTFQLEKPVVVEDADAPTAVDAIVPRGKVNQELKRRLAAAKRRNARKAAAVA